MEKGGWLTYSKNQFACITVIVFSEKLFKKNVEDKILYKNDSFLFLKKGTVRRLQKVESDVFT